MEAYYFPSIPLGPYVLELYGNLIVSLAHFVLCSPLQCDLMTADIEIMEFFYFLPNFLNAKGRVQSMIAKVMSFECENGDRCL